MKKLRMVVTHLYIIATFWFFPIFATTSNELLKQFIQPNHIKGARQPFTKKYLYVDKTQFAQKLCEYEGGRYFFARPPGFGKSIFLRTLEKIFEGKKKVFDGTYVHDKSNYSWKVSPVLYLDASETEEEDCDKVVTTGERQSTTRLARRLREILARFMTKHHLSSCSQKRQDVIDKFECILQEMFDRGNSTVILVDDYDYPILRNMKNCPAAAQINARYLKRFLSVIETKARCIQFAFITGTSTSVFATFGSHYDLTDLTFDRWFHDTVGITQSELEKYYSDHILEYSQNSNKTKDEVIGDIKNWFYGYNFSHNANNAVYNVRSVHNFFDSALEAEGYNEQTDRARHTAFVFDQIVKRPNEFSKLDPKNGIRSKLVGVRTSVDLMDPALIMYDAGYVTIHGLEDDDGNYVLKFPTRETEEMFYEDMALAAKVSANSTEPEIYIVNHSLDSPEPLIHSFMSALNRALLKLAYRPTYKRWYTSQIVLLIQAAGIIAERETPIEISENLTEKVDVIAYTANTDYLFQTKFYNEGGNYDTWEADVNRSIRAVLVKNKNQRNPKNILAAGFTISPHPEANAVMDYNAKLFAPNGTILTQYSSRQFRKED